jgi:hypothetical protein
VTTLAVQSTAGARRRSRLNQQSATAVVTWLQTEWQLDADVALPAVALPGIWEVVNGTALHVANRRWVLLPTETLPTDEWVVPQEWVDIPTWVADYYIAIQVEPGQDRLRLLGYTTHHHLKQRGRYDASDRAYTLDYDELWPDISGLWIAQQLHPSTPTRAEVAPLPPLSQAQAERLLTQLGNPAEAFPRRAVAFAFWGALLAHGGWRQRLYERRQGWHDQWSLSQWLHQGVSGIGQRFGWQQRQVALVGMGVRSLQTAFVRTCLIAGEAYELRVFMIGEQTWRFELRRAVRDRLIPVGVTLRLLTEDLQPMPNNEDRAMEAVERLYIDVVLEAGEGVVWAIDPPPEDILYQEILRF